MRRVLCENWRVRYIFCRNWKIRSLKPIDRSGPGIWDRTNLTQIYAPTWGKKIRPRSLSPNFLKEHTVYRCIRGFVQILKKQWSGCYATLAHFSVLFKLLVITLLKIYPIPNFIPVLSCRNIFPIILLPGMIRNGDELTSTSRRTGLVRICLISDRKKGLRNF